MLWHHQLLRHGAEFDQHLLPYSANHQLCSPLHAAQETAPSIQEQDPASPEATSPSSRDEDSVSLSSSQEPVQWLHPRWQVAHPFTSRTLMSEVTSLAQDAGSALKVPAARAGLHL